MMWQNLVLVDPCEFIDILVLLSAICDGWIGGLIKEIIVWKHWVSYMFLVALCLIVGLML